MGESELPDRIADTFRHSTVLITGATGFIGNVLLEKILRVTNVKRLYLLIRRKKGKSPAGRLQDIFDNPLFKTLTDQNPEAVKKCFAIFGDVGEVDLGVAKEDRETLKNEVEFIFHCAATTRFDDTLKYAITMNTRGTKFMLDLAEECENLKLFIHVSTAYAFPNEGVTLEKPYAPPVDPGEVLRNVDWTNEDTTASFSKRVLDNMPNTYTFSKALAEALVYQKVGKIPLIVTRPAVVTPTYADPLPGWSNKLHGPMGMLVAAGKGVIRSMYMDSKSHANFAPVDCVASALLATSWTYLTTKNAPYIFNLCIPECDVKVSWEELLNTGKQLVHEDVPFNRILWYPGGTMTKSKTYHRINVVLFQLVPAIVVDFLITILGYKPFLYSLQMKIQKGSELYEYYINKAWYFETKNIEEIRARLNEKEKTIYQLENENIDIKRDLKEYLTHSMLYMRTNLLKETDDMLPAARRNMKIMYVVDKLVKIFFVAAFIYYFSRVL